MRLLQATDRVLVSIRYGRLFDWLYSRVMYGRLLGWV